VCSPDHICSDEARAALGAYVSEHCCYGKAVIRDMTLVKIAGSNAYHVCIDLLPINNTAIEFLDYLTHGLTDQAALFFVYFIQRGREGGHHYLIFNRSMHSATFIAIFHYNCIVHNKWTLVSLACVASAAVHSDRPLTLICV